MAAYRPPGCIETALKIALKVVFWSIFWVSLFIAVMWEASSLYERKLEGLFTLFVIVSFVGIPVLYILVAGEMARRAPFPPEIKALLQKGFQEKLWTNAREARLWLRKSHNLHIEEAVMDCWVELLQKEAFTDSERPDWLTDVDKNIRQENSAESTVVNLVPVWQHTFSYWRFSGEKPFYEDGNLSVELLPRYVLCANEWPKPWSCLERSTGDLLWKRKVGRPNRVIGVENGVIIASELRSHDSPLIWPYGLYGLSLESGELLWTSHGIGGWGRFTRWLDFVPDFRNELRDTPLYLQAGAIVTQWGRLVNSVDGSDIGTTEIDHAEMERRASAEYHLRRYGFVDCGEYGTLHAGTPENPEVRDDNIVGFMPTQLFLEGKQGQSVWTLDLSTLPEVFSQMTLNYQAPYLFFRIASPLSSTEEAVYDQPEFYAIWIVDIRTGAIIQKLPISEKPVFNCVLQAVDDENMLVSYCEIDKALETLLCFSLIRSCNPNEP